MKKGIIVKSNLVEVKRGEVFTSSVIVSEKLEVKHSTVLITLDRIYKRWEKQVIDGGSVFGQKFKESSYTNKMNRTYRSYDMNEQAFAKLVMNLGGYDKAEAIQDLFIQEFYKMKVRLNNKQNNSWIAKREGGKENRLEMTDTLRDLLDYIKDTAPDSSYIKNPERLYANYSKMENKYLELLISIKDGKPIRDLASITELGFISTIDDRVEKCIKNGIERKLPYKEIYRFAKEETIQLVDSLQFKRISTGAEK